jgi:two-component system NtrC family sensor kinase
MIDDGKAELLRKLAAQAKTIDVLMAKADGKQHRGAAVMLLEQNAALEKLVAQKTQEIEAALAELHRSQAQRVGAQKLEAIGHLAAGIAHEINTPAQFVSDNVTFLTRALKGLTDALEAYRRLGEPIRGGLPAAALLEQAEAICRKAKVDYLLVEVPRALAQSLEGLARVTSLVGAMKEFSHPSQGVKTPSNLTEMIETTVEVAVNEWKYVAEMKTDLDPTLGLVTCLRDEMNQVLLNLIVNAAHAISDATQEGTLGKGTITITTSSVDGCAEICVADTGTGIPKRVRSRVFEPLFTTKPVGKGTGQGLAIARSIVVDKHGGTIRFETSEGLGTRFFVRVPMTTPAKEASPS